MDLPTRYRSSSGATPTGALLILASLLVVGCTGSEEYQTVTTEDADHAEANADTHHHEAPHGGHLIELGDHKYNAEVVLEADPKQLVVYLLGPHAETVVAIASEPLALTPEEGDPIVLEPSPQDEDAEGQASRFVATGGVIDSFADLEDVHGSLKVTIEGTEFVGELSHDHAHGGGAHAHEGE